MVELLTPSHWCWCSDPTADQYACNGGHSMSYGTVPCCMLEDGGSVGNHGTEPPHQMHGGSARSDVKRCLAGGGRWAGLRCRPPGQTWQTRARRCAWLSCWHRSNGVSSDATGEG